MFNLFNLLAIFALAVVGGFGKARIDKGNENGVVLFIPLVVYILVTIIPSIAVAVRRLHDSGKSGWWLLLLNMLGTIPFIKYIASVAQLVLMCLDSDPGVNQYGPCPKKEVLVAHSATAEDNAAVVSVIATATGEDYEAWTQYLSHRDSRLRKPGLTVKEEYEQWMVARLKSRSGSS